MNDKPQHDVIGENDLLQASHGQSELGDALLAETMGLVELLSAVMAPIRKSAAVTAGRDGPLMAALVIFAGAIQGELQAMGLCKDMSEQALTTMLLNNWRSGIRMGKAKVERIAAEAGVDPTTGMTPEHLCPGHTAMDGDPKRCRHCGVHIDSLRPDEQEQQP